MPSLRLGEIARATGGLLVRGDPETVVGSFAIDTRRLTDGGLFVALRGSKTDGHRFLAEAARAGAAAALVQYVPEGESPDALVRVPDTIRALGSCGALARDQFAGKRVLAITGSAGKTTTKELLAAGLSTSWRVHRTAGNFNNHLGVPLTLIACPDDAEMAVIEMGMSAPMEIAGLAKMARPDVALVTNIQAAHLQNFRSLDDLAAAKGELFAMLAEDGVAVVNQDDEHVRVQSQRHAGRRVTFGSHNTADVSLERIEDRFVPGAGLVFRYAGQRRQLDLRIGGSHAARNALAAMAAVIAIEGDIDKAIEGMGQVEPGPGRGRVLHLDRDIVLIDDSYNSNPAALHSVLGTLGQSPTDGRRVLVMGDMLELGPKEAALHREAGKRAAAVGVDVLFAVGKLALLAAEAGRRAGVPQVHHQPDADGAARDLPDCLRPGDLVLIKGSRSIKLERVVEALQRALGGA